jgi:DNA-binding transcriptional LysR family regulator
LHFGNAALRLGISQPQVSRHVANLERELGVALFVRTPRATTLTDAGSELLADALEAIASVQRLRRRAAQVARGGLGAVTVGFVWSTLSGYLAPLVSAAGDSAAGSTYRSRTCGSPSSFPHCGVVTSIC